MRYDVINTNPKVILISGHILVQDILSIHAKEFSSIPLDQIMLTPTYNKTIFMREDSMAVKAG